MVHDQAAAAGRERAAMQLALENSVWPKARAEIEGGRRQARGVERGISEAGAFADAAGGGEQSGDAERKSAARGAVGRRCDQPRERKKQVEPRLLRQALPQPAQQPMRGAALS